MIIKSIFYLSAIINTFYYYYYYYHIIHLYIYIYYTIYFISCIDLCKKLSESDFILNLRAYGYIPQLYRILSNEKDKVYFYI